MADTGEKCARASAVARPEFCVPTSKHRARQRASSNFHMAFEGDSSVVFYEGNYTDYEEDRKKRLGKDADTPHRIKYRKLTR